MRFRLLGRWFWSFGLRTVFGLLGLALLISAVWYIIEYCKRGY